MSKQLPGSVSCLYLVSLDIRSKDGKLEDSVLLSLAEPEVFGAHCGEAGNPALGKVKRAGLIFEKLFCLGLRISRLKIRSVQNTNHLLGNINRWQSISKALLIKNNHNKVFCSVLFDSRAHFFF